MPTEIKDLIDVSFTLGLPATTTEAFNNIMIFNTESGGTAKVETFSSLATLEVEYADTTAVYATAKTLFKQTSKEGRKISAVKVGSGAEATPASIVPETVIQEVLALDTEFWGCFLDRFVSDTIADSITTTLAEACAVEMDLHENKMLFLSSDNADIASLGVDNSNTTVMIFKSDSADYDAELASCWMGACLPDKLGTLNPCFYDITVVNLQAFTDTELGAIADANFNRIEQVGNYKIVPATKPGGTSAIYGGITSKGQAISEVFTADYLQTYVMNAVFDLFMQEKKINGNAVGLTQIESVGTAELISEGKDMIDTESINFNLDTATIDEDTYSATIPDGSADLEKYLNKVTVSFKLN